MEEKRREAGSPSPAATISGGSSKKSTDSPATEPPPRRRGQKRKSTTSASNVSSAPPKRHAREKAAAAAAAASGGVFSMPPIHNGPLTRARQLSDSNAAIFSALNAIKNEAPAVASDVAVVDGREEINVAQEEEIKKFEAVIDAEFERIRTRDSNVHVVPVVAGWFSWTNIHSIEKQTLQSFFNGKLESWTPDIYKEIRNWIMKRFHANPSTNIELKDLSELSVGDLEARQEILEFLEHWGLINYHPSYQNDPDNVDVDPTTDAEKAEKKDSLLEKLYQFESEQSSLQFDSRANKSSAAVPSGLFPESIAEELVKQEGPAVEYHCNSCSADCSRKRYHCQKQADFDLCSECYNNGKFGSGMYPSDFILMEPAEASGSTGGKWTDQETLLLLEALELFKENWNEIAEHVATKTKAQCILHFLQMPIEDSFLDYDDTKDAVLENGEPASTKFEISVPKVNSELSEGSIGKDNSGPAEDESGKDDGSEPSASKNSQVNAEPSEKKTDSNAAQPESAQMETSNLEDGLDGKVAQGEGDDIVIKALKEAFNVAGCPLTPEDKLCFAEAGNTVMALAAFLTQLVEPGLANVSARNSLKTMSRSSPGSQLAERHCFILEDSPEDLKDHIASESTTTEKIDQNASKMAKEKLEKGKEITHTEKSTLLVAENPSTEGEVQENSDTKDNTQLPPVELGTDDSKSMEKTNEDNPQVTEKPNEETELMEKSNEEKLPVTEKCDEEKSQVTAKPDQEKLKGAGKHDDISNEQAGPKLVDDAQNCDPQNEQSVATTKHQVASGIEPENLKTAAESALCKDALKDTDMGPTSVVSDKTEQQEISGAVPMEGVASEAGEDKMDVDKKEDTKNTKPTQTKDEDNVTKLKRAALATLSAAAVKAKLLANQEEDEIRQLATVLIEKQMRKLELKLSYFTEVDTVISRVREHLERSRQKLFNERAQIIASRLGIPPSSRMLPSSYPINRMPPGFVNSMMRPPMSLGAQRPPISRPVVTSAPPTTSTSAPPDGAGGNSTQSPAIENPSIETN